jgi:hypothetical protein
VIEIPVKDARNLPLLLSKGNKSQIGMKVDEGESFCEHWHSGNVSM